MSTTTVFVDSGLSSPLGLAFDSYGNLYCSNQRDRTISKITPHGNISLFASLSNIPTGLAFDASGNLYCATEIQARRRPTVPPRIEIVKIINGEVNAFVSIDDSIPSVNCLAFDNSGNLYCSVRNGNTIYKIIPNGEVTHFVTSDLLFGPCGLAFDSFGILYCCNEGDRTISKITSNGSVSLFITLSNSPFGLACDSFDNLYCSNLINNSISKITSDGQVSPFVVSGLDMPAGLAFDSFGNLYCANYNNNTITKTSSSSPIINTIINVTSSYTVTNGIFPFNLNASSNSPATINYSSSDNSIVTVSSIGLVTIVNSSSTPITITLSQDAITGYTSGIAYVSIQVNESTNENPTQITTSNELKYFLTSSSKYGAVENNINDIDFLLANTEKVLLNATSNIIAITN
jgi:sugar lactone lactonase YvrE